MKFIAYIFFLFLPSTIYSQGNLAYGFQLKLQATLGTHHQKIGYTLDGYLTSHFIQINIGNTTSFSLNSYANRKNMVENRTNIGALLLGGTRTNVIDFQLDGLNHQTNYQNSIGYNFLWYFDNKNTSQHSGGWSFRSGKIGFQFENDLFAGQGKDRFRSGVFQINYQHFKDKFAVGFYIWTGETRQAEWIHETRKGMPNGYKSLENKPYGKKSHGLLFGSYTHQFHTLVNAQLKIGIDSEQFRHIIQNRLIHDLLFLPRFIPRKTPHYPRLDQNGTITFQRENVRKSRFLFNLNVNDYWSN